MCVPCVFEFFLYSYLIFIHLIQPLAVICPINVLLVTKDEINWTLKFTLKSLLSKELAKTEQFSFILVFEVNFCTEIDSVHGEFIIVQGANSE